MPIGIDHNHILCLEWRNGFDLHMIIAKSSVSTLGIGLVQLDTVRDSTEQLTDIDALRIEIDRLDAEILAVVKRRTEVSQAIGKVRMASGGTRLVHSREMKVIERYSTLGPEGKDLAMLLLRMGRGRLGY